jgi:hypothetical protein
MVFPDYVVMIIRGHPEGPKSCQQDARRSWDWGVVLVTGYRTRFCKLILNKSARDCSFTQCL